MLELKDLRCNHEKSPKGINGNPVFSWILESDEKNTMQVAYQIVITSEGKIIIDTDRIDSDDSIEVQVNGFYVEDRKEYTFEVTVWDNHGNVARAVSDFEATPVSFEAKWIEPTNKGVKNEKTISMVASQIFKAKPKKSADERLMPVTLMRKEFEVKPGLLKARAYATAHGIYELSFNGNRPDERYFAPEFTAYGKYVCYQIYDVKSLLNEGENALGVKLADGWYNGRIGMTGECCQFGLARAFFLQLELYYEDGSKEIICSDGSFKWSDESSIRYADIFIGSKIDNRYLDKENGFDTVGYHDRNWNVVTVKEYDNSRLHAQIGSPVYVYEKLPCVKIITTPKGEKVVDLGQVFAGIVRMSVKEKEGTVIKLEHTEVLDQKGNFINNIMGPNKEQTDYFITAGTGVETFEPHFTFHGFRYIKVTGITNWDDASFTGLALTSKMDDAMEFESSNPLINQLYHNVRWSQYSNMISVPTDCPQRERAGWTGDFEIFTPTAMYNQDMRAFTRRWLENMEVDQLDNGIIPDMIPYCPSYKQLMLSVYKTERSAAWGDASIMVPWYLYEQYGDKTVLERFYPMMEKWFAYIKSEAENEVPDSFRKKKNKTEREIENQKFLWNTGWHYGDWLVPSISKSMLTFSKSGWMTAEVIAPMYYANDAYLLSRISKLLGYDDKAEHYEKLCSRIKEAFLETNVGSNGLINPDLQGLYVCSIWFDMVPEDIKVKMAEHLNQMIMDNGFKLDTGFASTPILLDILMRYNYKDTAFKVLYQEECPSWLYEVKKGATTIWENWAAIKPNGKVDIFSYNHYAFGGVFRWVYRTIGGIQNDSIAFKDIIIRPVSDPSMTSAKTAYQSVYGPVRSSWEKKNGEFRLDVHIPCNTSATVILPDGSEKKVGSGDYSFTCKEL